MFHVICPIAHGVISFMTIYDESMIYMAIFDDNIPGNRVWKSWASSGATNSLPHFLNMGFSYSEYYGNGMMNSGHSLNQLPVETGLLGTFTNEIHQLRDLQKSSK